jgi:hypothetical protein
MQDILQHRSKRRDLDGWAVRVTGAPSVLLSTVCTTREEARDIRRALTPDLFTRTKVVKVRISVEAIE